MSNDIILYKEQPIEIVKATNAISLENIAKQNRLFLASDVYVGQYGVKGFILIDNQPEERYQSYTDDPLFDVSYSKEGIEAQYRDEPFRIYHFINTDKGFKMIRYFVLPEEVANIFAADEFVGPAYVDKCCRDGTLPKEFDEVKDVDSSFFLRHEEGQYLDQVLESLNLSDELNIKSRFYFSFHPWQLNKPALAVGEDSIVKSINNFDYILSILDKNKTLEKRNLNTNTAIPYNSNTPLLTTE